MTRSLATLALAAVALTPAQTINHPQRRPGVASSRPIGHVEVVGTVSFAHGGSAKQPVPIILTCMGHVDSVAVTGRFGRFRFRFDPAISRGGICTLAGALAGFESTRAEIPSIPMTEDSVSVGTIVLSDGRPGLVSATSADAPKSARRKLDRARKLTARRKPDLDRAFAELQAAVAEYEGYAEAWIELGNVLARLERPLEALVAYGEGIDADPSFILSYRPAIKLARQQDASDLLDLWCKDGVRVDPTLRAVCPADARR